MTRQDQSNNERNMSATSAIKKEMKNRLGKMIN